MSAGGQRVFLVDGQAVYLEGGGDISEDVLQQALTQLTTRAPAAAEPQQDTVLEVQDGGGAGEPGEEDGEEGVLAVLQDEAGQQQTVRLTPTQAAALGIDYDELVAAAGQEPAAEEGQEQKPDLEQIGDHAADGGKGTPTFDVSDAPKREEGLLAKSRQIMVPQVRHGETTSPTKPAAAPSDADSRAEVKPALSPSSESLPAAAGVEPAAPDGDPDSGADRPTEGAAEEERDLPVIMTPMNGQQLPDYIEPRPGLKILVRPLEEGGAAPPPPALPLGSSDNPIQLVQQGNTFKSLHPLSAEQLKQIATVLQRSRLNVPGNAKNTIYDANTNTRIVYRVVYPEDSVSSARGRGSAHYWPRGRGRGRGRGRPRGRGRGPGRPRKEDVDEDWYPGKDTEMEPMDPAERKKLATKTRTGRLSQPPKHMVRDYKHIHRADLNRPEPDDSDAGYSDLRDRPLPGADAAALAAAGQLRGRGRPRRILPHAVRDRFTCRTCGALCIGYARLEAHYRKNPTHQRHTYVAKGSSGDLPPAKRARLEDLPEPLTPEQLVAALLDQSAGSVSQLCDTMAACLSRFRQGVREALRSPADDEPLDETVACRIDAERAALTGLPEGLYLSTGRLEPTTAPSPPPPEPDTQPPPEPDTQPPPEPDSQSRSVPAGLSLEEALAAQMGEPAERPPEQLLQPGRRQGPAGDALDRFVGGLVDTAAYGPAPDGTAEPDQTSPGPASMPLLEDRR